MQPGRAFVDALLRRLKRSGAILALEEPLRDLHFDDSAGGFAVAGLLLASIAAGLRRVLNP
jgi:hypothetical protein